MIINSILLIGGSIIFLYASYWLYHYSKNDLPDDSCCYHCLNYFNKRIIKEWTDKGKTPLCPFCGIDSVILDEMPSLTKLENLHKNKFATKNCDFPK